MQVNKCDRCEAIFDGTKEGGTVRCIAIVIKNDIELCAKCIQDLRAFFGRPYDNRPQS